MKNISLKHKLKIFIDETLGKLLINLPQFGKYTNAVFLIRTDNIGDYILFRNFLPYIRHSKKYRNRKLVLIGNTIWRDLAEHYDSAFIDASMWLDVGKYKKSLWYKYGFLFKIWWQNPLEIVNIAHSHIKITDDLTIASKAKFRTTCLGDDINLIPPAETLEKSMGYYNKIINSLPNTTFEFFRNKAFIENWLDEAVDIARMSFEGIEKKENNQQIIGFFIGAHSIYRQWDINNFVDLIEAIHTHFPSFYIEIYGGKGDYTEGVRLENSVSKTVKISNFCGKTTVSELVVKIAHCRLLISNESSAVHIAAAVDTPTVCVANGERFGRFSPYPVQMSTCINTIFPHESFYFEENYKDYTHKFQYKSTMDINTITPEVVLPTIFSILKNDNN